MSFVGRLLVKFCSKEVGQDHFGNRYYLSNTKNYLGKHKRYVVYNGMAESSKIPPVWHGWLHYLTNVVPSSTDKDRYEWQQEHLPNLTGTKYAYDPAKSDQKKCQLYSRWQPR